MAQAAPAQPYDSPAYNRPAANRNEPPTAQKVTPFPADRTRNVTRVQRVSRPADSGAVTGHPTVDDQFRTTYETAGLQSRTRDKLRDSVRHVQTSFAQEDERLRRELKHTAAGRTVRNTMAAHLKKKRQKASLKQKAWTRAKATAANGWISAWVLFFYTTVQLPFALASTAGLGISAYIYSYIHQLESGPFGFIFTGIKELAKIAYGSIPEAIEGLMDFSFGIRVNPMVLFIIPFALIFALGLLQLILCWFTYSLMGIKSLSGSFSSAKVALFILAGIGIALPILNLFPLIFIWTTVVWLRPR